MSGEGSGPGSAEGIERVLVRGFQLVLAGILGAGILTTTPGLVVNGALGLGLTMLPALLRREYHYTMHPALVAWISLAMVLHTVGSLGPYARYSWYDEITHTISATLIAGIGYASLRAVERHSDEVDVTDRFRALFVVVFVLAAGVVWELLEFGTASTARALGLPAPLTVMGVDDIVTDMLFNTVGALVVALAGTQYFTGLADFFRKRFRSGWT